MVPFAILIQACGLPGIQPNLSAPVSNQDTSNGKFTFTNVPQTSPDDFYGFEIYYKFYADDTGALYQQQSTSLTPDLTGYSQLVNQFGYRRAFSLPPGYTQGTQISQPSVPLIPVTNSALKTSQFTTTIDFSGMGSGGSSKTSYYPHVAINGTPVTIQIGALSSPLTIARYMADPTQAAGSGQYILHGFGTGDFATDQSIQNGLVPPGDVPQTLIADAENYGTISMIIGLYAIAYGLYNLTTPIYSTPTPLGYLTFQATYTSQTTP